MKKLLSVLLIATLLPLSFVLAAPPADFTPDSNMPASQVPAEYKWDLSPICANAATWELQFSQYQKDLASLQEMHASLDTPAGLAAYLKAYFDLSDNVNRITLWANLRRETADTDQAVIARHEKALDLTNAVMSEGSVLRGAILGMSAEELKTAMEKAPGIKDYAAYINELRRRADRVLSPGEERILALAGDNLWAQIDLNELPAAPEKLFGSLIAEMPLPKVKGLDGKPVQLTFSNYGPLRHSDDREVRKGAINGMFGTLRTYQNTLATALGEQAKFSLFLAKSRGYDTVLDAYLDKDDIDPQVYMNLVNTVRAHVAPLHKYVELRKKVLGFDDIHIYDLYVPMVEAPDMSMDYNTGVDLITKALQPMGPEYLATIKTGLDPANGWIDIYPYQGKGSGAFSSATYGIHPYVLMNFQNSFNDISTLAHEYGHALHSWYAMNNQSQLEWRYAPFLAEIASTCNEALLSRYMIDHAKSDEEKAWLLSELLETIRTTIYRQTLFADFELRLHQMAEAGEPITADKLNATYADLVKTYYGDGFTVDENDGLEWAYIPHFYYKYYVFTYATGLSSGIAFAEKITKEGAPAREAYLGMLKGGSSRPPLVLLKEAGLDLTKPEAIEAALDLFDRTVDGLDKMLEK